MKESICELNSYTNEELGVTIRTSGTSEEPWFCLADVCKALGLRQGDVVQRLDKGVVSTQPLQTNGGVQQANFVNEDGFYDVVLDSRKPEAKAFRKWITSEVLPSIRKTGSYATTVSKPMGDDVKLKMEFASWASVFLNLNDNSKLLLAQSIATEVGLDKALPQYTISKGVLRPVGALLKAYNINMSANAFNKILEAHGYIETLERKSLHGTKKFRHITDKGLSFGENQVSPHNPRETQPLWFENRFNELYRSLIS